MRRVPSRLTTLAALAALRRFLVPLVSAFRLGYAGLPPGGKTPVGHLVEGGSVFILTNPDQVRLADVNEPRQSLLRVVSLQVLEVSDVSGKNLRLTELIEEGISLHDGIDQVDIDRQMVQGVLPLVQERFHVIVPKPLDIRQGENGACPPAQLIDGESMVDVEQETAPR